MTATPTQRGLWIAALIGLSIVGLVWFGLGMGIAEPTRAEMMDSLGGTAAFDDGVVIVVADEEFVAEGRLDPFRYAEVLNSVEAAGASTVIVDQSIIEAANPGVAAREFDPVVAGYFSGVDGLVLAASDVKLDAPAAGTAIPTLRSRELSPDLAKAVDAVGLDNVVLGSEEKLRTVPLLAEIPPRENFIGGQLIPTAALVALARAKDLPMGIEELSGGISIGGRTIPTEEDQRLRVGYAEELLPGGAAFISATELLESPESLDFEDKVVVLGVTDPESARVVPTPVGDNDRQPSVVVQANATNTLLTAEYLRPVGDPIVVALAGVLAFLVALGTLFLPIWVTPLVPVITGLVFWAAAELVAQRGRLTDLLYPLAGIVLAFVAAIMARVILELRRRRRVTRLFARYVPPDVAKALMAEGESEAAAAGQRLEVTVLFCDLRDFTPYCAKTEPTQVRKMLESFYQVSTDVILDHGGTLMQFIGDEVFAVFGAPVRREDHAQAAIECAPDWQFAAAKLNRELKELGLDPVEFGIGVHSGEVVAAHVGSSHRRQYTVLGETVNIGARLCSQAAGGEIIATDATLDQTVDTNVEDLGPLTLKGIDTPIEGYRIVARDPAPVVT